MWTTSLGSELELTRCLLEGSNANASPTWILFPTLALKSGHKNLTWKDAVMVTRSGPLPNTESDGGRGNWALYRAFLETAVRLFLAWLSEATFPDYL